MQEAKFQIHDRVRFALELYNLASALNDESENEDTTGQVKKLATSLDKFSKDHKLPTFTGKTKHPTSNDGGNPMFVGRVAIEAQMNSSKPADTK